jgi:4-hydroxybenzoyl-CoA thioesterase
MLTNRRTIKVAWGECDPADIIFYPRYFEWFNEGTTALFERAGLVKRQMLKDHGIIGMPIVDARAKFIIPSSYGDEVVLESAVAEWRRSSFEIGHRVLRGEAVAVEGQETRVWAAPDPANPGRIKALPIPAEIIARFA